MVGYSGFSMSNNAIAAYENGLVPASKIKGVPASLVKQYCTYSEWHHSSKFYNKVEFYNPVYVRATFGLEPHEEYAPDPEAIKALVDSKAKKRQMEERFEKCRVVWLEWGGTRKHPSAKTLIEFDASVSVLGKSATVTLADGKSFVKRLDTKGFSFSTEFSEAERIAWVEHKRQSVAKAERQAVKQVKVRVFSLDQQEQQNALRKQMAENCICSNEFLEFDFEQGMAVIGSPEARRFAEWFNKRNPEATALDLSQQNSIFQQVKQFWINYRRNLSSIAAALGLVER